MIVGTASGSSTLRITADSVIPIPRAASTASRSTWRTPTKVLVRIGGIPSTSSAIVRLKTPTPMNAATIAIRPSSGIARPALPIATANSSPEPRWPKQTPNGSATAIEAASARTLIQICVQISSSTSDEASDLDRHRALSGSSKMKSIAPPNELEHIGDEQAHAFAPAVLKIRRMNVAPRPRSTVLGERHRDNRLCSNSNSRSKQHRHREQDDHRNEDPGLEGVLLDRE